MRNRLIAAASAAALSLALSAGSGVAQDASTEEQMRETVITVFAQYGWDTEVVHELTPEELTRVHAIAVSGESAESQQTQIESVLSDVRTRIDSRAALTEEQLGELTEDQMRQTVVTVFAQYGWDTEVIDEMTSDELIRVHAIAVSGESAESQQSQIESVLSEVRSRIDTPGAATN